MELKYKTQFADLEELSILGLYRRPIQRLSLTIMWIGVPIYIIIFALSKLYRYRFFDEITPVIIKGALYLVLIWIAWVIVFFLINHNNIKKIKRKLKILADEKPYLLEEKIKVANHRIGDLERKEEEYGADSKLCKTGADDRSDCIVLFRDVV